MLHQVPQAIVDVDAQRQMAGERVRGAAEANGGTPSAARGTRALPAPNCIATAQWFVFSPVWTLLLNHQTVKTSCSDPA